MIIGPTQCRELVFEFTNVTATGSHPSGRYDIDLLTGQSIVVPSLAASVATYLNMSWGDTDEGAPYYISWEFQTLQSEQLHSIVGNGQSTRTLQRCTLYLDGIGSWELTVYSMYDPSNPHLKRLTGGLALTQDTSVPTGYVYPAPYNILTVGNTYSGKVVITL